jgi:outer membrane protein insertion porin family
MLFIISKQVKKMRKIKKVLFIFIFLVLHVIFFTNSGFAQSQKIKVLNVSVEGATTASAKIIKVNSGFISGVDLTGEDIQDGIKKLWQLGLFSDIKVIIDKETTNGVYLIVKVAEYPRLSEIKYNGNKSVRKIKEKYKEDGFYNAKIDVSTENVDEKGNKINIIFDIEEGSKVKIKDIEIIGNKIFSDFRLQLLVLKSNRMV